MTSNPDVPPFTGYVETTVNALRLVYAAQQDIIPRITRRLNDFISRLEKFRLLPIFEVSFDWKSRLVYVTLPLQFSFADSVYQ